MSLFPWRQRDRCATVRARRQGTASISAPETTSSTTLWAGSQLLTTSSWNPGWLTSARKVTAWDQLSRGDPWHTWDCALMEHPGNWAMGTGEVTKIHGPPGAVCSPSTQLPKLLGPGRGKKHTAHPSLCPCKAPENLRSLDLGSAWNAGPMWDSFLAKYPGAWAV